MGYYDYMIRRTPYVIDKEHITNNDVRLLQLDDGVYKLQQSFRGWDMAPQAGLLSLCSLMLLIKITELSFLLTFIGINLCSLLLMVYAFRVPPRVLILDRLNDEVTFLKRNRKKSITFKFSEGETRIGYLEDFDEILTLREKENRRNTGIIVEIMLEDTWARYVWFMDKNRPLPPGTAFDPYREKDFQRRKAEGFPPPLYPSLVPTPEATPEQQKEREKYWKG